MTEAILKEVVLPAAFNKKGSTFVGCEFDKKYGAQDNFQSKVFFLNATVQKGDTVNIPLVVKFQPEDENIRRELGISVQFYNEIHMYENILPVINKRNICEDTFPAYYHGVATLTDPDKDVIIVEDLRPKGFRLTEQKVFIDIKHIELAMEKLGRFHALSYAAKAENPEEFHKIAGQLKEPSWLETSTGFADLTIRKCFHRAIDPLLTSGGEHSAALRRLLARVDMPGGVVRLMQGLVAPGEPLAVVCHGDFCRNNMLFRYTSAGPVDVRFFDLATARYASPAIDIAFFLLMNSTAAVRRAHWDQLLARYHSSLSSAAAEIGDVVVPSLASLQEDLRLKAIYGFTHVSFFLPMMLWGDPKEMESMQDATPEQIAEHNTSLGGDEGTELLRSMIQELADRGCLTLDHPFLKD